MSITPEQIANTARLARLKVDEVEQAELSRRISAILELVDQMQTIDTSDVEPMANALDAVQTLRADKVVEPKDKITSRDAMMEIAPASEDGLFLVPKVIE